MLNRVCHIQPDIGIRESNTHDDTDGPVLALIGSDHPERAAAESFVQLIFQQAYGAKIGISYPQLMSITEPNGQFSAVAGVRPADSGALFSEYYLDKPVEELLGVERSKIVEIGNLAPATAGQARWLICTLTSLLSGAGYTHVVFTAVPILQNAFRRMGLPLVKHADARPECLPTEQIQDWGSYYDSKPAVFSGEICIGERAFRKVTAADPKLHDIAQRATRIGRDFTKQRHL